MTVKRPSRDDHPDWSETDEAMELLYQAALLGPEGESIDLNGDYSLEEIVRIKQAIGTLRKAGEVVNRALAQAWEHNFPDTVYTGDDWNDYGLSFAPKRVFQPDRELAFAAWLKDQDQETIAQIVGLSGIRVRPIPWSVRDAVFDEEQTSEDLRITARRKEK